MLRKLTDYHGVVAAVIVAAALLLRAPGLRAGLYADDYVQAAMLDGAFPASRSVFALYDYGGRDDEDSARLREFGWFPWWSAPELRIAMFRPLASGLVAVDHALARRSPPLRHLHSAAWLALLLAGAAALMRVAMPPALALLALCLLAADPSLSVPLSWLANRAALVAGAFGVWGLYAYLRWRRGELRRVGGVAAGACFVLSVLACETGWAFAVYPIARECVAGRGALGERVRALAIALGPAAAVLAAATAFGYGVSGSGQYISLLSDPARYLAAVVERVPALAADLVWGLPAGDPTFPDDLRIILGLLAYAALAFGARSIWSAMSIELRALLLGCALSLPLVAGALPEARLLIASAVGFAAAVGFGLGRVVPAASALATRRRTTLSWLLLAALCSVLALKTVRAAAAATELAARAHAHMRWARGAVIDDTDAQRQRWFVIAGKDFTTLSILPFVRRLDGRAMPRAYRVLSAAPHAHELRRIDRHTLELTVLDRNVEGRFAGSLFRPSSQPFHAGQIIESPGMRVRVLRTSEGNPIRAEFRFERAVDDPSHVFLRADERGLRRVTMPAVGELLRVPTPRAPALRTRIGW